MIQEESSGFFQLDVHHPDSPYGLIQDVLKPVFRQEDNSKGEVKGESEPQKNGQQLYCYF